VPTLDAIYKAAECWFADAEGETELEIGRILYQTADRLRLDLYEKRATAYFFGDGQLKARGRHAVDHDYWATEIDALYESAYFPFGRGRGYEAKPGYPLFLLETELNALLSEQKAPLPAAKKAELAAALRQLGDLTRKQQREALSESSAFQKYLITDKDFREAAKDTPRKPGRKKRD
jgi:hypothetical protein